MSLILNFNPTTPKSLIGIFVYSIYTFVQKCNLSQFHQIGHKKILNVLGALKNILAKH